MVFGIGRPPEPNKIDTIAVPGTVGCMGLVPCPGVRVSQHTGVTRKHLVADIEALKAWGVNGLVSLIEPHEFKLNKVEELPKMLTDAGIWWLHLPIIDMEIPNQDFEDECSTVGELCENGNPGEFCCRDGCPRNYCTAKPATSSVKQFSASNTNGSSSYSLVGGAATTVILVTISSIML